MSNEQIIRAITAEETAGTESYKYIFKHLENSEKKAARKTR